MFKNYLKIAIKNILKNKIYSLINILGLAIGMALSMIIFLYILNEFSYDNFHKNKDFIYRVNLNSENGESGFGISAITTAGIGPSLIQDFPAIESMVRFSWPEQGFFNYNQSIYKEKNVTYTDSSVFQIFTFKLLQGDGKTALKNPFTVVITEKMAKKVFGNENLMGKMMRFNNEDLLLVTGVVKDFPENSQLKFDALISFSTLYKKKGYYLGWNGGHNYYTYIKLNKNNAIKDIYPHLDEFMEKNINKKQRQYGAIWNLEFEPLKNIHLYSDVTADLPTKGNLTLIYILSAIAFFILLIAGINFVNLTTAQSSKRAKEIAVRKSVGATRKQLIVQFLGESVLISIISLLIAFVIIDVGLAKFNSLIGADLSLYRQGSIFAIFLMVSICLLAGLISGSFPAFYLSAFRPSLILKGNFQSIRGKPVLRNILVFFQFFLTSILIIATLTFFLQLKHVKNQRLGFEKSNVINVYVQSERTKQKINTLKNEFSIVPGVRGLTSSSETIGTGLTQNGYVPEGSKVFGLFHVLNIDYNFIDLMKIDIIKGRNFSKDSDLN